MLGWWINGLRWSFAIYGILIVLLALLFLWRGSIPSQLKQLIRGVAVLWPLAYFTMMDTIPLLGWSDWAFGVIIPALFSYVLPEFASALMECYYHIFGWPRRVTRIHRAVKQNQLSHTLLRPRRP